MITIYPKIFKLSKKVQKKKYIGLVINLKKKQKRFNGIYIRFGDNRLLAMDFNSLKFIGTRVDGPICKEITFTKANRIKFKKIISFSSIAV